MSCDARPIEQELVLYKAGRTLSSVFFPPNANLGRLARPQVPTAWLSYESAPVATSSSLLLEFGIFRIMFTKGRVNSRRNLRTSSTAGQPT
jgi:hypothetical protein